MSVYFIQQGNDGPIKIGVATNPIDRMINLQKGSGQKLELLGVIEGDTLQERELHKRFSQYRLHHEWFMPGEEILEFISQNTKTVTVPTRQQKRAAQGLKVQVSPLARVLGDRQGNLSANEFAKAIGVSEAHLSRFVNGHRDFGIKAIHGISAFGLQTRDPLLLGSVIRHTLFNEMTDDQCLNVGQQALDIRDGKRKSFDYSEVGI